MNQIDGALLFRIIGELYVQNLLKDQQIAALTPPAPVVPFRPAWNPSADEPEVPEDD